MIAETTNPDFKILAANDELVEAVLVVVGQDKGGHIVSSHRPEWVVAWMFCFIQAFIAIPETLIVESLQRAVSADNGERSVRRTQLPNRYRVRSIGHLQEFHICQNQRNIARVQDFSLVGVLTLATNYL